MFGSGSVRFRIIKKKKKECHDCAPVLRTAKKKKGIRGRNTKYPQGRRGYKRSLPHRSRLSCLGDRPAW